MQNYQAVSKCAERTTSTCPPVPVDKLLHHVNPFSPTTGGIVGLMGAVFLLTGLPLLLEIGNIKATIAVAKVPSGRCNRNGSNGRPSSIFVLTPLGTVSVL